MIEARNEAKPWMIMKLDEALQSSLACVDLYKNQDPTNIKKKKIFKSA